MNSAPPTEKKAANSASTAIEILLRYPWPGNVRELRNLVERLVIVCPQPRIEPHHLPPELFRGVAESPQQPYSTRCMKRAAPTNANLSCANYRRIAGT